MSKVNNKDTRVSSVSIVNFEQANADWNGMYEIFHFNRYQLL